MSRNPTAPSPSPTSRRPSPALERLLGQPKLPKAVAKRYVARHGYANYWYNQQAQQRLWRRYLEASAIEGIGYAWRLDGSLETGDAFALQLTEDDAEIRLPWGRSGALFTGDVSAQLSPPRSGGLLLAIHAWQRLVDKGLERFGEVYYLGQLPHGPDETVEDCLVGLYEGMEVRFFFNGPAGDLTGIELFSADDADPCEIAFSQFAECEGRRLPQRWWVRSGDGVFAEMVVKQWTIGDAKGAVLDAED